MPSLEAAPLLFTLTHLSEAAAAARPNQGRHGKTQTSQAGGGAAAGGRPGQGQKRSRARREDDEEEEEDQHDEEDDDTDEEDEDSADEEDAQESHPFMASAVSAAVPASSLPSEASSSGALVGVSAGWTDGDVDAVADSSLSAGRVRLKKEADIDGVARAEFPIVQTIHATAWLGREVDVKTIARRCNNAVFVPVRHETPDTTQRRPTTAGSANRRESPLTWCCRSIRSLLLFSLPAFASPSATRSASRWSTPLVSMSASAASRPSTW